MNLFCSRLPRQITSLSPIMAQSRATYSSMAASGHDSNSGQPTSDQQPKQQQTNTSQNNNINQAKPQQKQQHHAQGQSNNRHGGQPTSKRSTSPSYTPNTSSPEENVYVLTILTDTKHHQTMTKTREKYFPKRLNRLEAHLTLFHALPGTRLEEAIKPTLSEVASSTAPFGLLAAKPFRLTKGIAIGLPKTRGGDDARQVHGQLKEAWKEFLSRQDAGGFAAHYTIMNKVDDEELVAEAFEEVEDQWRGCQGTAEGLSLFRYDKGNWVHIEDYRFSGSI